MSLRFKVHSCEPRVCFWLVKMLKTMKLLSLTTFIDTFYIEKYWLRPIKCVDSGHAGSPGPCPHVCSTWRRVAAWAATEGSSLCSRSVVSRSNPSRFHTAETAGHAPWSPSALCGTFYPHDPERDNEEVRMVGGGVREGEDEWDEEEKVWEDDEGKLEEEPGRKWK